MSADVARVHALPDSEPVVLFARGGARMLDALLAAPQQSIEELVPEGEVMRYLSLTGHENRISSAVIGSRQLPKLLSSHSALVRFSLYFSLHLSL